MMIRNVWIAPILCVAIGLSAIAADQVRDDQGPTATHHLITDPIRPAGFEQQAAGDPLPLTPMARVQPVSAGAKRKTGPIWAHLASYRSRTRAMKGWAELRRTHYPLLEGCAAHVTRSAPKKGKGVYYRLGCRGLTSLDEGRWLCAQLRKDGQYCMPLRLTR